MQVEYELYISINGIEKIIYTTTIYHVKIKGKNETEDSTMAEMPSFPSFHTSNQEL